jgi:hypothetical protein
MKLFHHGYQGKHERGQVPQQRDDDRRLPAADELETQDGQERVGDPLPEAGTQGTDMPARQHEHGTANP